jgi:uncharacterized delta-60 repeat protein
MKKVHILIMALLFAWTMNLNAQNAPGDLDLTFNGTGKVILDNGFLDLYQDVKMMSDGRIVAVGTTYDATYASDIQVACFLDNGTPDPGFGTNGIFRYHLGYETGGYACHPLGDGSLLVAGISMDSFGGFEMILLKLNDEGVLDSTFGTNGIARYDYGPGEDIAYAMTVQQDGKIILAGTVKNNLYQLVPALVRFNADGTLDTTFGVNGLAIIPVTQEDNEFAAVRVQPDGKIVAAGHISNGLSWFSLLVARFDAAGVPDPSFGATGVVNMNLNNVDDEFFDLRIAPNGDIVATGFTTTQTDLNYHLLVTRFNSTGALVPGFGNNGMVVWGETSYNVGYAMDILPDGNIVIAGSSGEKAPADADWGIWKLKDDGTFDQTFGNGGVVTTDGGGQFDEALGISFQNDGRLVAAGKFRINDNIDFGVARYQNTLTVSVPEKQEQALFLVTPNPAKRGDLVQLDMQLTEKQSITVDLMNLAGKVELTYSLDVQHDGMVRTHIAIPEKVATGFYILRVTGSKGASGFARLLVTE